MGPADWEQWLHDRLERPVEVKFNRSRTMPLRFEDGDALLRIRMHRFFQGAPEDVAESMARWITSGRRARKACTLLDDWIDARLAELPRRKPTLNTRGAVHDLGVHAESLFAREFLLDFEGREKPAITWGRRAKSSARRTIMLGSYQKHDNVVRIHPVLDRPIVPSWYVRFILFHEILHAVIPSGHVHHTPAFRRRERTHPDYRRACLWESKHIARLIKLARKGSPSRQAYLFPWRG